MLYVSPGPLKQFIKDFGTEGCDEKGIFPYEAITMDNYNEVLSKSEPFTPEDFHSELNQSEISAKDYMMYLSTAERNRIRFSDPAEIAFTKIDIALPHVKDKAGKSDWELYLMELKESKKEYTQISLIWNGDKADQKIVFTGLTTTGSLAGWKFQTAELMSVAKLNKNRMTQAEIRKITVAPAEPLKHIHPAAPEIKRTNPNTSPDAPEQGGSIIYHK
jgi:hypothetical protein